MSDYSHWIDDLVRFKELLEALPGDKEVSLNIKPGASESRIAQLDLDLSAELPKSIKSFLRTGSSGIEFRYWWKPSGKRAPIGSLFPGKSTMYGGGRFCDIDELADNRAVALDIGNELADVSPGDGAFWSGSFPFFALSNGDMLGLYADENQCGNGTEWRIAYLDHDGCGSEIIESSFEVFMEAWARLFYICPHYIFEYFRNPITSTINLECSLVPKLRGLFQESG